MSSELETLPDSSSSGLLGHTSVRAYGAVVTRAWEPVHKHPGWGTGFAVGYGVARSVQVSLELAYYRHEIKESFGLDVEGYNSATWHDVRQATMSLELKYPNSWIRPSLGVGFGVYEMTETQNSSYSGGHYRSVQSGTRLGVNWGAGVTAQLDQRIAIEVGGRYHHSFGQAFLTGDRYMDGARLFNLQAGLSYVVR